MPTTIWRRRPSHSTLVSYLALVVALGTGGAYAADKINSSQIARKAVKAKHIAPNAITSSKVAPGSLLLEDFAPGQIPQPPPATSGASGPRAYALVDAVSCAVGAPPQTCQFSQAQGVTQVNRVFLGRYCVTAPGIDSRQTAAAVSLAGGGAGGKFAYLLPGGGLGWGCGADTDYVVVTEWLGTVGVGTPDNNNTEVVTDDALAGLNGIGFSILIP
jgi:hypothetical protein